MVLRKQQKTLPIKLSIGPLLDELPVLRPLRPARAKQ
jgi:hypothetical protein